MHRLRRLLHRRAGYVWVNKEEIAALAAEVGMELDEFEAKYVRESACARA